MQIDERGHCGFVALIYFCRLTAFDMLKVVSCCDGICDQAALELVMDNLNIVVL